MRQAVLALSPHLDDAAFSCGGVLAALADGGHRVIVATVFARSMPDPKGFALACQLDKGLPADVDYMALRRDEDAVAIRQLGAEPLWLDFAEAPHRGYGCAAELFAGRRDDDVIVSQIAPLLQALIERIEPILILGPRAVGDHVDHHAVRDALRITAPPREIALWTDSPYALRSEAACAGPGLHRVVLTPDQRARKIAASCAYTSQIGFQFGGPEQLRQALESQCTEIFEANAKVMQRLESLLAPAIST